MPPIQIRRRTARHRAPVILAAILAAVVAPFGTPAHSQANFPERPVRVILPFSAGGGPDLVMRMLAEPLGKRLGQPVVIENRPGANGILALEAVLNAPADGHTLGIGDNGSFTINPHVRKVLPYDPRRSFAPVTILYSTPFFLLASNAVQASTWRELAATIRSQPGRHNFGSPGVGSPTHLDWELLKRAAGLDITHVPHKGLAPLMTSMLAGDVATTLLGYPPISGPAKAGKLRILAVAAEKRSEAAPNIPTLTEAGGPADFRSLAWVGLVAPQAVPQAIVSRLVQETTSLLADPAIRARIEQHGFETAGSGPGAFAARIEADLARYGQVIERAGIPKE